MDKTAIYVAVGTLVIANIGTIVTVVIAALRLAATFGAMRVTVDRHTKDLDAAHGKIREIEHKLPRANTSQT